MDSVPRRWVLKPLSPLLQPSDLRTISSPSPASDRVSDRVSDAAEVVLARPVTVSKDDEWSPSNSTVSSPTSSDGSHSGFYSFVDDPSSPEAELNQAWMVSPQRQVQLNTLQQKDGFRLQSYGGGQTPGSLFLVDDESRYRADSDLRIIGKDEEKQLREEIIRNQAPKKTATSSLLDLDLSESTSNGQVRSTYEPKLTPLTGDIDKDQTDFGAVRQQFLEMEQDHLVGLLSPMKYSWAMEPKRSLTADLNSGIEQIDAGTNTSAGTNETPIEREIRLVQEREDALRRARGIRTGGERTEMVQIQTKRSSMTPLQNFVPQVSVFESEDPPSPCCPHRHPEKSNPYKEQYTKHVLEGSLLGPTSWRGRLQSRGPGSCPDLLEKEVEEVLRREQELKDQREFRERSQIQGLGLLVNQEVLNQIHTKPDPLRYASSTSSSSSSSSSSAVRQSPVVVRGLTETLIKDFEERRMKMLLQENSYAGIQLVDDINNEVVESTRVTRHKNKRAIRWEAGEFNVQD